MLNKQEITVNKKKKGFTEPFDETKIHAAIRKSAERILQVMSESDCEKVSQRVLELITDKEIGVKKLHRLVENALDDTGFYKVAESYRQYRNYKEDAQKIMEAVDAKTLELSYKEDRSNANADSLLVSTKRSILFGEMQKERYKKLYLTADELEAAEEGYIYIHDMKDRLSTFNCCLYNLGRVLKGGFTLSNQPFTEPNSLGVAMSIAADHISAAAGQQYGGFTIPQIDEVLIPYAEKSYNFYLKEYAKNVEACHGTYVEAEADKWAEDHVRREAEQQYQHIELTLNTIASSRGDFPFTTFTFGHSNNRWAKLISKVFLETRRKGQGIKGKEVPVLFPKLVFLYDSELHGKGAPAEDLFDTAIETAKQCMYPDFLSLDAGYVGDVYHKYGKIISPMGCRAFLSPVFKNSGWITPQDENDEFEIYRCNLGVVSLNLPMIYYKASTEGKEFFEVLDYYMELGRSIGKRVADYLYKLKASCDPLVFMEGGFDGGTLRPDDCIKPVLKRSTISFGYGGLHELTELAIGKSLSEDPSFALETMKHINANIEAYKKEDHLIWAIYGTPGESWLPLACEQFIKKFGKIKGVTDKGFFTNSFHACVDEDITPIEKIELEAKFFPLSKGGCINHVKIPSIAPEMNPAIKDQVRYAMSLGLYHSVNHAQNRCLDCGNHWIGDDSMPFEENYKCPVCGSMNTVGIRRMNGYLGYSKTTQGKTKFNDGKEKEFKIRKNL